VHIILGVSYNEVQNPQNTLLFKCSINCSKIPKPKYFQQDCANKIIVKNKKLVVSFISADKER